MHANRFEVPAPPAPAGLMPSGFVLCPFFLVMPAVVAHSQLNIYQVAYAQARAAQQMPRQDEPLRHERLLFSCFN